ncbi:MAG: hypothetical protein ACLFRD_09240 [Nitriliruptoraceae bacterium]
MTAAGREPGEQSGSWGGDQDEALARLEDVLHALPFDRAVPDLDELLAAAGVDEGLLHRDERARKLLHEALLARPYGSLEAVRPVRTEVELLTIEVEVLTDRLRDPALDALTFRRTNDRLAEVSARLDELRRNL